MTTSMKFVWVGIYDSHSRCVLRRNRLLQIRLTTFQILVRYQDRHDSIAEVSIDDIQQSTQSCPWWGLVSMNLKTFYDRVQCWSLVSHCEPARTALMWQINLWVLASSCHRQIGGLKQMKLCNVSMSLTSKLNTDTAQRMIWGWYDNVSR